MSHYNVVNPEAVDDYLQTVTQFNPQLERLLNVALRKPLLQEDALLHVMGDLNDYGDNPPGWLVKKFDAACEEDFYIFTGPGMPSSVHDKVLHVRDWIKAAIKNKEEWTKEEKPVRLCHFRSLDDAYAAADRASETLRANYNVKTADPNKGTRVVMFFPDGWRIRLLKTDEAKKYEGVRLKHCVGDGAHDGEIYSLRDPQGNPVVTMQVSGRKLIECRGMQNSPPPEMTIPYLRAFTKRKGGMEVATPQGAMMDSPYALSNLGLVLHEGDFYSFYNLPEAIHIPTELDLTRTQGRLKLPEKLSVNSVVISAESIPPFTLNPKDIKTNVEMPDSVHAETISFQVLHKGRLHSKNGGASQLDFYFEHGSLAEVIHSWDNHGKAHREDGPASVKLDHRGLIKKTAWILDDNVVRDPQDDPRLREAYIKWQAFEKAHNDGIYAKMLASNLSPQPPA